MYFNVVLDIVCSILCDAAKLLPKFSQHAFCICDAFAPLRSYVVRMVVLYEAFP